LDYRTKQTKNDGRSGVSIGVKADILSAGGRRSFSIPSREHQFGGISRTETSGIPQSGWANHSASLRGRKPGRRSPKRISVVRGGCRHRSARKWHALGV